jgi:hypothetical protein
MGPPASILPPQAGPDLFDQTAGDDLNARKRHQHLMAGHTHAPGVFAHPRPGQVADAASESLPRSQDSSRTFVRISSKSRLWPLHLPDQDGPDQPAVLEEEPPVV